MPAETNQHREALEVEAVLDLLATVIGRDAEEVAEQSLDELDLVEELTLLHLWDVAVEELGERAVGELDLDEEDPTTLADLAALFHANLVGDRDVQEDHP